MFWKERYTRIFLAEMFCIFALAAVTGLLLTGYRENRMQNLLFWHDAAIASSLLEQGIEKEAVATALLSDKSLVPGEALFYQIGMSENTDIRFVPGVYQFCAVPVQVMDVAFPHCPRRVGDPRKAPHLVILVAPPGSVVRCLVIL